ncbi:MAG: bifunctional glutamate N-acetyltransferase/amino-acid acetyltransferase ArgJ [Alphaproteobacteria bacterium]
MTVSPLAPDRFPDMPTISGVRLVTAASGTKYKGRDDMMAMLLDESCQVAGVFTMSDTAAAAVAWSRTNSQNGVARAIITNAGNANAFTGAHGHTDVKTVCSALATRIGASAEDVLIASTGVIGERLNCDLLINQFDAMLQAPDASWADAAAAIKTTDTFAKGAAADCEIEGQKVQICGIAKGSGMIAPNKATMLVYVTTDANIAADALQDLLRAATKSSFNAITVDSDTSTSDSVFLVASGAAGHRQIQDMNDPALDGFRRALDSVMQDLARQIVRDGEGASKFITIDVTGATDDASAHRIGMAIANSPLVKTAIAGEDANWGRIVMAVGKAGENIDQSMLSVTMGGVTIARAGGPVEGYDETPVAAHMANAEIDIAVSVGTGSGTARVWTCDFTHGYISINADYRS